MVDLKAPKASAYEQLIVPSRHPLLGLGNTNHPEILTLFQHVSRDIIIRELYSET
jgi:hypothetical protein